MKKGDIVKLKSGNNLRGAELSGCVPKDFEQPELFTVMDDASFMRVGCSDDVELVMNLEELGSYYYFECKCFEVVLPAGQPDVNKLMEESVMAIAE